ncbi:hypothetical protein UK12_34330, partial [Saccharothrix sp. ST-888]
TDPAAALRQRLAGPPADEQEPLLLELVFGQVAAVLGYAGPSALQPSHAFRALGFDPPTAVALPHRPRARAIAGIPGARRRAARASRKLFAAA